MRRKQVGDRACLTFELSEAGGPIEKCLRPEVARERYGSTNGLAALALPNPCGSVRIKSKTCLHPGTIDIFLSVRETIEWGCRPPLRGNLVFVPYTLSGEYSPPNPGRPLVRLKSRRAIDPPPTPVCTTEPKTDRHQTIYPSCY